MARISNYGLDVPQSDSAVSAIRNNPGVAAQSGSKMAEPQPDPVKMLQYAKDAGTRNVESMGQIGSSWFDGIPQVYDDDQIAAAKSAISRAQTPEEVTQIIQGLAGQNHGGNVDPISNALGQMGVGYSSDAGLSDIGRGVRSMTGTLDRVDVPYEDDYEHALQWIGNAIPNVAAISDFAIPLPSGAASTVHLYKGAKALPGKVVSGVKAAPGKAADWYKGRYNAYSDRLAGKKPAASAETAAPAAERTAASETAAPAAERTAASETAAPAPRQEPAPQQPAPAPRQEPAPQQPAPASRQEPAPQQPAPAPRQEPAPAPRQEPAPAEGSTELRPNENGTPDLAGAINGEGAGAAGREATAAGEQAAGAGRAGEAAADGGVSELANAGNAGRETAATGGQAAGAGRAGEAAGGAPKTGAGEAAGSVSEGVDSASQQLIQHIRSGTLDEMERAWIGSIADTARAPGMIDESTQAILNEARAAGLIP